MMKKIMLLGSTGQLGWELHRSLLPLGEILAIDYPELDFTNFDRLRTQVLEFNPSVIVNAAAYTAVDQAESQPDLAMTVNAQAPRLLAELACQIKAGLVHYSTDFVYDGKKGACYTEADSPNPLSVYGRTKLAGDEAIRASGAAHLIFRTSWVYSSRRDNFVRKVLGWAHSKTELRVVEDQTGCPTSARTLAEVTAQVLAMGKGDVLGWMEEQSGLYHLAGRGYASRYEWAREIVRLDPKSGEQTIQALIPARSEDFPTPAERPAYSPLDCSRFENTFGLQLPDWRTSLRLTMNEF